MTSLHLYMLARTTIELGRILCFSFFHMRTDLQQELSAPPPSDFAKREECVATWIARLNTIKSALGDFPTIQSASATTIPGSSSGVTTPIRSVHSSQAMGTDCLERDQYECIITGRGISDGFSIEVAQIIPHALAKDDSHRSLNFWKMLDIFYGTDRTNTMFAVVAGNTNGLENLVALDNSIHTLFDNGSLTLTPQTFSGNLIGVMADHTGGYYLSLDYPGGMETPDHITSTKVKSSGGGVKILHGGNLVPIVYRHDTDHSRALLQPALFALRSSILDLQRCCAPRKPTTTVSTDNDSDGEGDPVLATLSGVTEILTRWVRSTRAQGWSP